MPLIGSLEAITRRRTQEEKMRYWLTGLAVAMVAAVPAVTLAQYGTTTEKAEKKAERAADKVESKTERAVDKAETKIEQAKGATKDTWITAKAKIALYADDRVSGSSVHVDTRNGVVNLRGKVATEDEKKAAEEVAKGIEGATSVKNQLQVVASAQRKAVDAKDDDITKSVKTRLKKEARLKGSSIDVRADKGVVTLTGEVKDLGARVRASEVARGAPGVRSVKNELKEKQA
jgi:osmotically-inducible protein OsmY